MLHATTRVELHMSLLTVNNFTQQIITSKEFSFEFIYSFRPNHARKLETEMLLASLNNIYITGSK